MADKPLRRRITANRRIKPPHPSPSPSPSPSTHRLHRKVVVRRSSNTHSKFIRRYNSDPTLLTDGISIAGDEHRYMTPPSVDGCLMFRTRIAADVCSSSPELLPNSPEKTEHLRVINREAKVLIKVMVEGSVGPVQILAKLGSSVDETIKLVMDKYNTEGRSPRLDQDAMASFELHHSNFSLQCLDKSNMIGDIGSRSFYLRKSVVNHSGDMYSNSFIDSEIVVATTDESPSPSPSPCLNIFLPNFIYLEFKKMIERTSKIWRFFGCFGG